MGHRPCVVVFDHATKQLFAVHWVDTTVFDGDVEARKKGGGKRVERVERVERARQMNGQTTKCGV